MFVLLRIVLARISEIAFLDCLFLMLDVYTFELSSERGRGVMMEGMMTAISQKRIHQRYIKVAVLASAYNV